MQYGGALCGMGALKQYPFFKWASFTNPEELQILLYFYSTTSGLQVMESGPVWRKLFERVSEATSTA